MLTFAELEAITEDWFMLENGKAVDIYFNTSWLLNYLLKQKKGLWERPDGGLKIRIPLEYDGQESGFYGRGDPISSDDRESLTAAFFPWIHAYGNATVYRIDMLKNAGDMAKVSLVTQRVSGAQKSITKTLAESIYDEPSGNSKRLTGLLACCNANADLSYGGIAENDLKAQDGTKPWTGRVIDTAEGIALHVIRTMATTSKVRDGKNGKIDTITMREELFNILVDILTTQQRYTDDKDTANAGFTGIKFEGKTITPDDYAPAGTVFGLNSAHAGFAVHQKGLFVRSKWKVVPNSAEDRTMKIYFDGNLVVNNRKAQIVHKNLS
jgi:hypothetical protein